MVNREHALGKEGRTDYGDKKLFLVTRFLCGIAKLNSGTLSEQNFLLIHARISGRRGRDPR